VFHLPGGKREKGESDWEALRREIQEELNVRLIAQTFTELIVVQEVAHGYTASTQVTMRCFGADYRGEIMANSEIEAIAWLRYRDLDQCAPATQRVLEYLYQQQWIDQARSLTIGSCSTLSVVSTRTNSTFECLFIASTNQSKTVGPCLLRAARSAQAVLINAVGGQSHN
jgi:8-oxo-dGTP diphosphatase